MSVLDRVLEELGAPAHAELIVERQELLRFGRSRLTYQHSEERVILRAKLIRDGRVVWGTLGRTEPEAVRALRERLESIATSLPRDGTEELPGPVPARAARTAFPATQLATAEERVELFREALRRLPAGATLGGSITHVTAEHAVGNTQGVRQAETRTRAAVQMVATVSRGSSWRRVLHRDSSSLSDPVPRLEPLPERPREPGRHRAVLAPQAVATLLATLGQVAFAAGAGVLGVGEQVCGEGVTIVDDGCDEDGLPSTFDSAGRPKQRVSLVEKGVVAGFVDTATGHSVPPGWRFGGGPAPSHLLLAAGDADEEALLQTCGDGLFVQRIDYVRVVQPRQALVTGSSRDGTAWIEGGRLAASVPQFRFTVELGAVFRSMIALGARRERSETVFMESVVAPAMTVTNFPVDLVTA